MAYRDLEKKRLRARQRRMAETPEQRDKRLGYFRRYYQKRRDIWNTPERVAATLVRRREKKDRIIQMLGGVCMDCGQSFPGRPEVFDLDHRDPFDKIAGVARLIGSRWETIADEVEKCDLVCANCHRTRSRLQGRVNRKAVEVAS